MPADLRTFESIKSELAYTLRTTTAETFNRATEARTNALFKLAEMARAGDISAPGRQSFADVSARELRRNQELRIDPAARAFFSRQIVQQPIVSEFGNLVSFERDQTMNGRRLGPMMVMRSLANLEGRTYTALNTSTGGDGGGYTAPIDFWAEVIGRMKAYDGIFDCARWFVTATGTTMDIPLADDTSSVAATVVENNQVLDGTNPVFLQLQFGTASLWSTGRILLSLQLLKTLPLSTTT